MSQQGANTPLPCGRGSDRPLPHGRGSDGPLAYLITFPTYGSWLHGDERGSVDREHNLPGTPLLEPDQTRRARNIERLQHRPVVLERARRAVVRRTIVEVAEYRDWTLRAVNVRTNHVHIVIGAPETPERIMNALKSWSTCRMVQAGVFRPKTRAWVRHGSTRYLWKPDQVQAACRYVCEGQGVDLAGNE